MQRMFSAPRAKFLKFDPIWIVAPILLGGIVPFFAIAALKRNHRANVFLFRSHTYYLLQYHSERNE
jgi:predicted membrane protein